MFSPFNTNSNKVFKFSGLGEVTKMLEYPKATAPANEKKDFLFMFLWSYDLMNSTGYKNQKKLVPGTTSSYNPVL